MQIVVAGVELVLRADGSAYRPDNHTLYVADLHLGKAASFRSLGVPVPDGACEASLNRLSESLSQCNVTRLVVLGDLWHDQRAAAPERVQSWIHWLKSQPHLCQAALVLGNHDRKAGSDVTVWGLQSAPEEDPPFRLLHEPTEDRGPSLCGHIHPAANMPLKGRQRIRLPAFWRRGDRLVLPAYGGFTGTATVTPVQGDQLYVLAEDRVVRIV